MQQVSKFKRPQDAPSIHGSSLTSTIRWVKQERIGSLGICNDDTSMGKATYVSPSTRILIASGTLSADSEYNRHPPSTRTGHDGVSPIWVEEAKASQQVPRSCIAKGRIREAADTQVEQSLHGNLVSGEVGSSSRFRHATATTLNVNEKQAAL